MRKRENFEAEVFTRAIPMPYVIQAVRAHVFRATEIAEEPMSGTFAADARKTTVEIDPASHAIHTGDPDSAYPYVLVMDRGESDVFQHVLTQRIAGYDPERVAELVGATAQCLKELHAANIVHVACMYC
jgi:hypothetical protein